MDVATESFALVPRVNIEMSKVWMPEWMTELDTTVSMYDHLLCPTTI